MHTLKSNEPIQPVAASLVENWIEQINEAVRCSTGWAIQTGQLLLAARKESPRILMFEKGTLRFGLRTAEILLKIARHPTFPNSKYFSSLPSGWSVLHVFSQHPGKRRDAMRSNTRS